MCNIVARVKFNDSVAYVLDKKPELKYYRLGNGYIYGIDDAGIFITCYTYDTPSGRFYAFGGRKFDINLADGEVVKCYGQWWHGGFGSVAKHLGITLGHATIGTVEGLINCYVFSGYECNLEKMEALAAEKDLPLFEYRDYEKFLKYDDMRSRFYDRNFKLEKKNRHLIREVKQMAKRIKELENG